MRRVVGFSIVTLVNSRAVVYSGAEMETLAGMLSLAELL